MKSRGLALTGADSKGRSRWTSKVALAAMLGALAVTMSGCSWKDVIGLGWPKGITPEAHANYDLWIYSVVAAFVVGGIVYVLLFWTTMFHRKKDTDTELPRQFGYNMPLELALTVIPFLIISVLFYFTVVVQEKIESLETDPEVVIDVTAFQWNWKFGYQSVNYADGSFSYEGLDEERKAAMVSAPEGVDEHGKEQRGAIHGKDPEDRSYLNYNEIETLGTSEEIPVLVLPEGKPVRFVLASSDVIHSFWVPEFLFKRDVMPDPEANHSKNVFQVSEIQLPEGQSSGAFVGRCAEMCGTYHAMMNFEVRVVNPVLFQRYIEFRQGADGMTNAEALKAIGEEPLATTTKPFETRRTATR